MCNGNGYVVFRYTYCIQHPTPVIICIMFESYSLCRPIDKYDIQFVIQFVSVETLFDRRSVCVCVFARFLEI